MKYCKECDNSMEDDMSYCQKCGSKFQDETKDKKPKDKLRKSMKIWMIICIVFSIIYLLMSASEIQYLAMAIFLIVLSIMFFVLGKSPKGSKNVMGNKVIFVLLCVFLAFILFEFLTNRYGEIPSDTSYIMNLVKI